MSKGYNYEFVVILNVDMNFFEDLQRICSDIREIDPTFVYHLQRKKKRILLYEGTKDMAYKRGLWFKRKTECVCFFKVLENKSFIGK